jgi:GntR family transcriptional regulator, colanic acid and biofilm gene transcriptional regulator
VTGAKREPTNKVLPKAAAGAPGGNGTLYQFAYSNLRQRILDGEWLPETKLTLRGMAAELGTSPQPVREAMNRLVAERVLQLRPNFCVIIPSIDKTLLDELWFLRTTLEGEAARVCAPHVKPEDHAELDDALQELRHYHQQNLPADSMKGRMQTTHRIPLWIAARCGSVNLKTEIENLRLRTAPYYAAAAMAPISKKDVSFLAFAMQLQEEFINSLKRGNGEVARDLCKVSIYTYQHYVYRRLGLE